jgi:hypothetical protein
MRRTYILELDLGVQLRDRSVAQRHVVGRRATDGQVLLAARKAAQIMAASVVS